MPKLEDLTKKEWTRIKKNAGIEKEKKFLKSDASVGKHVSTLVSARDKFNTTPSKKSLETYFLALTRLGKALTDFSNAKDLDTKAAKSLKTDIGAWQREIDAKSKSLAAIAKNFDKLLASEDKARLKSTMSTLGLKL